MIIPAALNNAVLVGDGGGGGGDLYESVIVDGIVVFEHERDCMVFRPDEDLVNIVDCECD